MLSLLVENDEEDSELRAHENAKGLARRVNILKSCALHWANSQRVARDYFYFASISSKEELMQI